MGRERRGERARGGLSLLFRTGASASRSLRRARRPAGGLLRDARWPRASLLLEELVVLLAVGVLHALERRGEVGDLRALGVELRQLVGALLELGPPPIRQVAPALGREAGAPQGAFSWASVMPSPAQMLRAWARRWGGICFQYDLALATLRRLQATMNVCSARDGVGLQAYAAS